MKFHSEFEEEEYNPSNPMGRRPIMEIAPPTDKLQQIKLRCFQRLDNERHEMIRKRREASGFGTYSKRKGEQIGDGGSSTISTTDDRNLFSMPRNSLGQITKRTKQLAHQVDQHLLDDQVNVIQRIMQAELQEAQ